MGACFETGKAQEWAAGLRKSPRPASQPRGDIICETKTQLVPYPAGGWDDRTACPRSFNGFRGGGQPGSPGTKDRRYSAPQRRRWDQPEPAPLQPRTWDDRTACPSGFGRFPDQLSGRKKVGSSRARARPETDAATAKAESSGTEGDCKQTRMVEKTTAGASTAEASGGELAEVAAEGSSAFATPEAAVAAATDAAAAPTATAAATGDAAVGTEAAGAEGEATARDSTDGDASMATASPVSAAAQSPGSDGASFATADAAAQGASDCGLPSSETY